MHVCDRKQLLWNSESTQYIVYVNPILQEGTLIELISGLEELI